MPPGERPQARYVNSYQPSTLVGFVSRAAVLARFASYSDFVNRHDGPWKSVGGFHSQIDSANRELIEKVETWVNAAPRRVSGPSSEGAPEGKPHWCLLAFYDSTAELRSTDLDGSGDSDRVHAEHTEGELPGRYFLELLNGGPARSKPEVLVRGMAMRSFLLESAGLADGPAPGLRYRGAAPLPILEGQQAGSALGEAVRDLTIVACAPPTSGGMEATRLLAEAGTLAIAEVRRHLLAGSPISWRLMRVVTECLRRRNTWTTQQGPLREPAAIEHAANDLLREIHEQNPPCIYRARSLWEEAAGRMPKSGARYAWISDALQVRAAEGRTALAGYESPLPVRERLTAAWVYVWRAARADGWRPQSGRPFRDSLERGTQSEIESFVARLREPEEHPTMNGQRRDRGLLYAADFIEHVVTDDVFWYPYDSNEALSKTPRRPGKWWTSEENVEARIVESAITRVQGQRRLNDFLKPTLGSLAAQACLTIDGISRRECLTTLQYAGLEAAAADVFYEVIASARRSASDPNEYRWLIETSTFALGWMTLPSVTLEILLDLAQDQTLDDSIRMTALMAIGDMAEQLRSSATQIQATRTVTRQIIEAIPDLARARSDTNEIFEEKLLLRSAVYVLAMLRQPDDLDILRMVATSERFEENTTPALAQWGLDRIFVRLAVNEAWKGRGPAGDVLVHTDELHHLEHPLGTLRRLIDPLASLERIVKRRGS